LFRRKLCFIALAVVVLALMAVCSCRAEQASDPKPSEPIPGELAEATTTVLVLQLEPIMPEPLKPVGLDQPDRSSKRRQDLRKRALTYRGTPYVWGASRATGFDCSGFTQYLFAKVGIHLLRRACEQFTQGAPVELNELRIGDLVFFNTTGAVSHVGMFIGDGKFVHASSRGGIVRVDTLKKGFYRERFVGARRFVIS